MIILYAAGVILVLVVVLFVLLFARAAVNEKKAFYTETICSLCGKTAGIKGNKRYVFKDGCVCENCLKEIGKNTTSIVPNDYKEDSVQIIKNELELKRRLTAEEWQKYLEDKMDIALAEIEAEEEAEKSLTQDSGVVHCPKCGSDQLHAGEKGFSATKAAVGYIVAGTVGGLVAGGSGAKKVQITCLNCGYQWFAGKG